MAAARVQLDHLGDASDPRTRFATVELPPGYRRVFRGAVKPGDLYADRRTLAAGPVRWLPLTARDLAYSAGLTAQDYDLLIRPDAGPVEPPCDRCRANPRRGRNRYCTDCGRAVLREAGLRR